MSTTGSPPENGPVADRQGSATPEPIPHVVRHGTILLDSKAGVFGPAPSGGPGKFDLGDYELLEEIARGGMGVVYKARQKSLNRTVALKMILAGKLAGDSDVKRFRAEAEAAGSLSHPHIVGIYEVGEVEGQNYFTMPFVDGPSLTELMISGRWPMDDGKGAARLMAKVAHAVQHAHEHGILHRDLKPGNILVDSRGEPQVMDFGLAKRLGEDSGLTLSGAVLGTPSFMAPEQAAGRTRDITAAVDIYGLGAVLYYLLTGQPPVVADSPLNALVMVLEGEARMPRTLNPRVPAHLERICMRCLEKEPRNRYASGAELAEDLERFLRGEPPSFRPVDVSARIRHWLVHHPALASRLFGVGVCAVISQIGYSLLHHHGVKQHQQVVLALAVWLGMSVLCQWGLNRDRAREIIRFMWAAADVAILTAVLLIDRALESPLLGLYPALVVVSGLWMRVPLVAFTTGLTAAGYGLLLFDAGVWRGGIRNPHWHVIFFVGLLITGCVVTYLVHRVRVLSRLYEQRPLF